MQVKPDYLNILEQAFERRKVRNKAYTLRSFAKLLEVSPGFLSKVLNQKRHLSLSKAHSICDLLVLDTDDKARFIASLSSCLAGKTSSDVIEKPFSVANDMFDMISDITHYTIVELTKTKDFKSSRTWIAKKLGITSLEADLAIRRLIRLGLLVEVGGVLKACVAQVSTADKTKTSVALINHQMQILKKAMNSLISDPIEKRSMLGMTMAIDSRKLDSAKTCLNEFLEDFDRRFSIKNQDSVYQLGISFFPLVQET